jgi:hypothetical protein
LVLLVSVGLASASRDDAAEATTGVIVGSVVDENGHAVARAAVAAGSPSGRYATHTDARGRFALLGIVPDVYSVSIQQTGYASSVQSVRVASGQDVRVAFHLIGARTIGVVRANVPAFAIGSTSDSFAVEGDDARAHTPTASAAGLATYTQGTVQGAIADVPGVDLDPFGNAILRGGSVGDTVFEFNAVPIPQGLVAEPGGNVAGAQLPTTGVASTIVTLAGYTNESDNALGGVVNQIPSVGTYPGNATLTVSDGLGTQYQQAAFDLSSATPDLKWRYALSATASANYFPYGDGRTFYPAEAGTYGLALQSRGAFSIEGNVHALVTPKDDVAFLALYGQAAYDQYASPYPGETVGAFDGATTTYPGASDPTAPVDYASGIRGNFDVLMAQWQHSGASLFSRVQAYQSRYGSSAGGPFWDENGFPDGSISLSETQFQQQYGINLDNEGIFGPHHLRFGAEFRTNTSYLNQVVPTADEFISSNPTVISSLLYAGDTWSVTDRLDVMGTARATYAHFKPSAGTAYDTSAVDPHAGISYRIGSTFAVRVNYDRISVAPAPLEADRTDSTNVDAQGNPAPFVPLSPETANDFTYSFEGGGRTRFRVTYYQQFEHDLIDVLPYNFRSATAAGLDPSGVGVPTNVGQLRSHGLELNVRSGGFSFNGNFVRAYSSSASQFAYNDLNAPAIAAGQLVPVGYEPDLTAAVSYEFVTARKRLRITPSLSYSTGYPYGNGTMVWIFDPATGKPIHVPNDNYVNPGSNYYFLQNPAQPYNATTNPYIGNLGTNEGTTPNTLRSTPQTLVNLHVEGDITPRLTLVFDVANLLGTSTPTAYQGNPYLIGPPGYKGGNPAYAACYGQILAGTAPCAPGLPPGTTPYILGNGIPTNTGVGQSVPWTYGTSGYVPQSYPMGRTFQLSLKYRL